jgi:hypothetical protein
MKYLIIMTLISATSTGKIELKEIPSDQPMARELCDAVVVKLNTIAAATVSYRCSKVH